MRFALQEAQRAREQRDEVGSTRAWKLFLLLPRLLMHRPPRGGLIPKCQLQERFTDFAAGRWAHFLEQSRRCDFYESGFLMKVVLGENGF